MSSHPMVDEGLAFKRAKRRLKAQITYLALMLAAALVARHYVVGHLQETARSMAQDEERARDGATVEVGGAVTDTTIQH